MTPGRLLIQIRKDSTRTVTVVDSVALGRHLRELRERADISLRSMAKLLGVSAPYLSDAELGRRTMALANQKRFVELCQKQNV